jgi:hypothetical protein
VLVQIKFNHDKLLFIRPKCRGNKVLTMHRQSRYELTFKEQKTDSENQHVLFLYPIFVSLSIYLISSKHTDSLISLDDDPDPQDINELSACFDFII